MTETPQPPDPTEPAGSFDAPPPPPPGGAMPPPPDPGAGWGQAPPPPPPAPPMGPAGFSVGAAFSYGWKKFTENAGPIILVAVALFAANFIVSLFGSAISRGMADGGVSLFSGAQMVGYLFNVITWVIGTIVGAVIIKGALDLTAGKPLSLSSMTSGIDFVQVVVAALLVGVMVFVGLVLCILPGIVVLFMTWFTTFFIVGQGLSAVDAIKASFQFVGAHFAEMVLLMLAGIGVLILGTLACLIGLVVAYPVVLLANAYAFRVLNNEPVAP